MKKKIILLLLLASMLLALVGCGSAADKSGVQVVFNLEGGVYKNSTQPITYYYKINESETSLIRRPEEIASAKVTRDNYEFVGWFRTKTGSGASATYSDEWDFDKDTVDSQGVVLYACWKKQVKYSYRVCYKTDDGNVEVLGTYSDIAEGQAFSDFNNYGNSRQGYTLLGFVDENGNDWDSNFGHPGGDTDTVVDVFGKYVKGKFKIVSDKDAFANYFGKESIYLTCDIDMSGKRLSVGFRSRGKDGSPIVVEGNGFTVSNITVSAGTSPVGGFKKDDVDIDIEDENESSLYACLFQEAEFVEMRNITFANMTTEIAVNGNFSYYKLYVSPFAVKATDCKFTDVKLDFTIKIKSNAQTDKLTIADKLFVVGDAQQQIDCTITINRQDI